MDTYTTIADVYDTLTGHYPYERWLNAIEDLARDAGMTGNRLLDVACGTGSSFLPLLDRYEVTACDISPPMLTHAALRSGDRPVRLLELDMRKLPVLGEFDLVLCLDDTLNHLLEPDDVEATLRGFARNLAPDGVAVFDVNTLAGLRMHFSHESIVEGPQELVLWRGTGPADLDFGGSTGAAIDVLERVNGHYVRRTTEVAERHYPLADMREFAARAGLEVVQVLGQVKGARIQGAADELRHTRALFVTRRLRS
jgi:SAM-dependent methyltransferase